MMRPSINNDQLAHEYRAGATLKELAHKYQRTHSAILYRLMRYGQARRINGAPLGNQNWKGKKRCSIA